VGAGKQVTIYISPIDAVAPVTVPAARRLLYAKALTGLLTGLGYDVQCHCLFADDEQAVKNLTVSVWLRYLELCGENIAYPEDCYQGDYIFDFAATVHRTYSNLWHVTAKDVAGLRSQAHSCADMYDQIQEWLGGEALSTIQHIGLHSISRDIGSDLREIDVGFDSWPWASALLRDGTVTEVIDRLKASDLVHSDGRYSYINLPPTDEATHNKQLLENETGPTSFAVQLSHFVSVFGKKAVTSDLNIYIYDIGESERIKLIHHCIQSLQCPVASIIEKPLSSPHLLELGEVLPTSPLAENFISFREVRQTIGLRNLQWLFAAQQSSDSVKIDLSEEFDGLCFQQCSSIARNPGIQNMNHDPNPWSTALAAQDISQRQQAESFLQAITEFHDMVNKTMQLLEPALLVNYYRNLCERFLVYYNNHELITPAPNTRTTADQYSDNTRGEAGIVATMAYALHRLLARIDPIIGSTKMNL
jgi:arginyl-tRNA synthetase